MVVAIFGFVGMHWSQSTLMALLFPMECLAHILAGAFKAGVKSIKSDDG